VTRARLCVHPAAVVLGAAFVIVAWNASWLETHAAAVWQGARDAGAVLCVLAAWAMVAGTIRAVTRQQWVTRTYGHLELDLSPLPGRPESVQVTAEPDLAPARAVLVPPPGQRPVLRLVRDEPKAEVSQ
jgi:hypothetical protein